MSRTSQVIKGRNKIEREVKERRKKDILRMKIQGTFQSGVMELMSNIDVILEDEGVKAVIIEVKDNMLPEFSKMILESDELGDYEISQVENETNQFYIQKKLVRF